MKGKVDRKEKSDLKEVRDGNGENWEFCKKKDVRISKKKNENESHRKCKKEA